MDRLQAHSRAVWRPVAATMLIASLLATGGCAPMLATGIYVLQGGNLVPAECDALRNHRVVIVCRPPSSHEYRHAGASRNLSQQVSELLVQNVKGIDVVNPREVDNWLDEEDWGDFKELANAVHADHVVHIELNDFDLYQGKTLYRGRAQVAVTVYDMTDKGRNIWQEDLGEILYPTHSGIPAQDKPVQQFEREFVAIVAESIAQNFYKHDPNAMFAVDAKANR
jgi:hypothetical protein